jgi:hypothetical protein
MRGKARILIAAGSIAAVALVLSLVTVSTAAPATKVTVIEHATTDVVIDTDGDGADSTGDLLTWHNEVFDATNTSVVGTSHGDCIRVEVGVSWECRWVTTLEEGSIAVEGPFLDAGPSTLAITGGTGAYKNAGGTMKLTGNEDGTEFTFAYKVIT